MPHGIPLTESVKCQLAKQADWQEKVEGVAARMAAAFAEEIQALVDPSINRSKLVVVKTITDELGSNLKD
ncbi:MAG: hypothetical protein K2H85_05215, partial [Allobaculum sp.]|nr:hypothetical protein [Allobaculum sp.]